MDPKQKTFLIFAVMGKRSTIAPKRKPVDGRLAAVDHIVWDNLFTPFNPKHAKEAAKLIEILVGARDFQDYIDLLDDCRTLENDRLFLYALYSSVAHRDDCQGVILPPIQECAPHWFFAAETIHEAIQLSIHFPNEDFAVINRRTAELLEPESRLAYFREDIGLNAHHWAWHVVFPIIWNENVTGKIKDRKGELFYYMHQQMVARYNCERLSNSMNRVLPLQDYQRKLLGYFPHMTSQVTGVHIGSRPEGLRMRDTPTISIQEMEVWMFRILEAIDLESVRNSSGSMISLNNEEGIDILGAVVEASSDSVNREFYGDLHNTGHRAVGAIHDPDGTFRELPGVMTFTESAPRDPIFYEWHQHIDDIFQRHKSTLNSYTREELSFEGITISNVEINAKEKNIIETFMKEDYSDLSHAPFLKTKRQIWVRYEHLDFTPFTYNINIENATHEQKQVTIRIFLGPKLDESGNLLNANAQRRLMIELDKFQKQIQPGMNLVTRHTKQSSVTGPRPRGYRVLLAENLENEVDYCSCGWPENLLVPKGNPMGMEFALFVMCTDYTQDAPDPVPRHSVCTDAISYCGAKDQKYPDKKPMGYPFDRRISTRTLANFLTRNMVLTDVRIKFLGSLRPAEESGVKLYENAADYEKSY